MGDGIVGALYGREHRSQRESHAGYDRGIPPFKKKNEGWGTRLANMQAAVTLYVAFYNFCRVNGAVKKTPAMAAGIADRQWGIIDLLGIVE